ncbi:MAG TPA: hypothetical protein VG055_33875 [Planctomycetaceae bacterium]|jgi:hypothetical protein|nr:hypothetical protein [Planctomycetaceae bacterium]
MSTTAKTRAKKRKMSESAPEQFRVTEEWQSDMVEEVTEHSSDDLARAPSSEAETAVGAPESSDDQACDAEDVAEARHPVVTKPEYCMVVSPADGTWPQLEIFPGVEAMAKRMRELEGREVIVFPFLGIPVPFTLGPSRFFQLPDGRPHPVFDCSEIGEFLPKPDASLPIDTAYYIGPDSLREDCAAPCVIDHRPASRVE